MGKDGERGRERRDGGGMNFITKLIPQTYVLSHEANNGAIHSRGLTLIIQPSFQGSSSGVHWGYKPPPTSSQQGGTSHAHLDIKAQAFPAVWSPWVLTTFPSFHHQTYRKQQPWPHRPPCTFFWGSDMDALIPGLLCGRHAVLKQSAANTSLSLPCFILSHILGSPFIFFPPLSWLFSSRWVLPVQPRRLFRPISDPWWNKIKWEITAYLHWAEPQD